jgi:TP901 family phage tail tape measure protein
MADETYEAALRLVLQDELTNALNRTQAKSDQFSKATAGSWKKAFIDIKTAANRAAQDINRGQRMIRSGAMTAAAGIAAAAPLALAAKAAGTFQDGMAEVATLTDKSAKQITAAFGPIVNETRRTFGKEAQSTIKALYDGFSAGVPKTQEAAKEYLDATGQMALGGKTDMAAAADAITTVKNAWAFQGLSFQQIVDQTFAGVQEGKTTVTELSASMGQAAATVSSARIKYEEFIGATAALTAAGVKTPQAMTQITAAITAINKPSLEASKAFKKIGAEITPLTLKNRGFAGTLDYITERVNRHTTSEEKRKELMNKMFSSVEAMRAVTLLAGDANEKFKDSTEKAAKAQGLMGGAADKMREGPMHKYRQAVQDTQIAWENFGTIVAPIFTNLLDEFGPVVKSVSDWVQENDALVQTLAVTVLWLSAAAVAFGVLKAAMGVALIIKGVATALWGMNAALLANPIVLIAAAVVAGLVGWAAMIYLVITRTEEVGLAFQYMGLIAQGVFNEIQLAVFETFQKITDFLTPLKEAIGIEIKGDWTSNIEEQQRDLDRINREMDANLNETRIIMERREELDAGKKGGGGGDLNLGGITNNITLPVNALTGTVDPEGLAKQIAEETRKEMEKVKKQKNREDIGK